MPLALCVGYNVVGVSFLLKLPPHVSCCVDVMRARDWTIRVSCLHACRGEIQVSRVVPGSHAFQHVQSHEGH